jgi:hypothetical protein
VTWVLRTFWGIISSGLCLVERAPLSAVAVGLAIGARSWPSYIFAVLAALSDVMLQLASSNVLDALHAYRARESYFHRKDEYELYQLDLKSKDVATGLDQPLRMNRADFASPAVKRWSGKGRMYKELEPLYVFLVHLPSTMNKAPRLLKSYTSVLGPSLVFVYDHPADSIYARFRLYHELGHVGWSGVSWSRRYAELAEVALVLVIVSFSWHSTRALWMALVWALMRLILRLSRYTALKYEINADIHAINMMYAVGCSADDLSKVASYLQRCGNRFRSIFLARACSKVEGKGSIRNLPVYEWWMGLLLVWANIYAIRDGLHVSWWFVVVGLFILVVVAAGVYFAMGFMLGCVDWLAVEIGRGGWRKYEDLASKEPLKA